MLACRLSIGGLMDRFGGRRPVGPASLIEQSFHVAPVIAPLAGRCPETAQDARGSPAGDR
jgi:hypothetical protein